MNATHTSTTALAQIAKQAAELTRVAGLKFADEYAVLPTFKSDAEINNAANELRAQRFAATYLRAA